MRNDSQKKRSRRTRSSRLTEVIEIIEIDDPDAEMAPSKQAVKINEKRTPYQQRKVRNGTAEIESSRKNTVKIPRRSPLKLLKCWRYI